MANENIERQMEFLLQQEARHAARMEQLEEIVLRLAQGTRDRFKATDKRLDDVDERIAALVDSQIRTEENVKKTEENIKKTEENIKKTDEALRRLIAVVDRYLSEGRNGSPKA